MKRQYYSKTFKQNTNSFKSPESVTTKTRDSNAVNFISTRGSSPSGFKDIEARNQINKLYRLNNSQQKRFTFSQAKDLRYQSSLSLHKWRTDTFQDSIHKFKNDPQINYMSKDPSVAII